MSLVHTLYHSRRFNRETYRRELTETPMAQLVRELEQECALRGLTLSRWRTASRRCMYIQTITWAAHRGPRPASSYRLADDSLLTVLHQTEGATAQCTAYRQLSDLLAAVRALPIN